jgi:hypothetical protein
VRQRLRWWSVLVVVCAALAVTLSVSSPARADSGLLTTCATPLTQPFAPWLDPLHYGLVPGGSFEASDPGWTLAGGAAPAAGNEPWYVAGNGQRSLAIPNGATVVTQPFCIGLLWPTTRFFVRSTALLGVSTVAVSVDIDTGAAHLTVPVGVAPAVAAWAPSLPLPLLANATSILGGTYATARLRFTAVGGSARIDDVYVDPFKTS